jgi:hypothetical protein
MEAGERKIDARKFVTRWQGVEGTYELIDGQVVALGPCTFEHARVNGNLLVLAHERLSRSNVGGLRPVGRGRTRPIAIFGEARARDMRHRRVSALRH